MAQEAVLRVKQAEDSGKEMVRAATEQARQLVADARKQAVDRRTQIIDRANEARAEKIAQGAQKAQAQCDALAQQGRAERDGYLAPQADKRERAIKLIMERIVS